MTDRLNLKALFGDYPNTRALKAGEIRSPLVSFEFAAVKQAYEAFKPMVREQAFDVGELAIVTFLQAKVHGKPYVLMPAVAYARSQHHMIVYNAARGTLAPADLPGRRVGVRAYSQTTGAWLRGILRHEYGVDTERVKWVTFEDPHVAEYSDPPGVERAAAGKKLLDMLLAGELDAAILAQIPDDPRIKSLIPDAHDAARAWSRKHGLVPINHPVVIKESLSRTRPDAVKEIYRLLVESKKAAGPVPSDEPDPIPFGVEANRKALEMIVGYCAEQKLIPRRLAVDELFDDTTRALG
jgi:4,5-dihydroxyphthalate decarboxylase